MSKREFQDKKFILETQLHYIRLIIQKKIKVKDYKNAKIIQQDLNDKLTELKKHNI